MGAAPPAPRARLAPEALAAARLGILGGSFDPPHLGHLHAARAARRAFRLDHVVFVPAARPPHKPGRVLAEGGERLAMLELLLEGEEGVSTWGGELERSGPSYSVDTVRELLAAGVRDPHWILGSDNLAGLPGWHEAEEFLALARPVVVFRRGDPVDPAGVAGPAEPAAGLSPRARRRLEEGLLVVDPVEASSSELRRRLGAGEDPGPALPAAVREYARARGIYTA